MTGRGIMDEMEENVAEVKCRRAGEVKERK